MLGNGFSIRDAIGFGWHKSLEHFYLLMKVVLAIFVLEMVLLIGFVPLVFFLNITQNSYLSFIPVTLFCAYLVTSTLLIISVIRLGILRVLLDIYERNSSEVTRLFSCSNLVFTYLCALILLSLIMLPVVTFFAVLGMILPPAVVGIIGLIAAVGMIFIQTRFAFYVYPIVDVKMGAIDALKRSWRITQGSVLRLIIFEIILGLIPAALGIVVILNILVTIMLVSNGWSLAAVVPIALVLIALFFVALIVPVIFLANVYAYKKLVEHTSNNNGFKSLHPV